MSSILLNRRARCASEIALAETIRTSKVTPDPLNAAYLKGAKAAMKLLNRKLAVQQAKSNVLHGHEALITRETHYAEMQ